MAGLPIATLQIPLVVTLNAAVTPPIVATTALVPVVVYSGAIPGTNSSSTITQSQVPVTPGATTSTSASASSQSAITSTDTGSSNSSTESSPVPTGAAASLTTSASSSPSSTSTPAPDNSRTGLIAGVAVLGAVALIALLALAFVLFRSRRRKYVPAASVDKDLGYDPSVIALKDKVASLQDDLNAKDASLRETQAGLLASGRGFSGPPAIDDKSVHNQFSRLNKDIADWVLTHFKSSRPAASPPRELTSTLIRTQPNYSYLMQETRTRFLILRAIAADIIAEAMNNGTLFGNDEYTRMRESLSKNADRAQLSQWRALTASLLSSHPSQSSEAAASLAQRIDYSTSSLVNAPASDARVQHLQHIVSSAQQIAVDLAKQRADFTFERPQNSMFDGAVMEDVLQERRPEDLRGKKVQSVVFPAVFRFGNSEGAGYQTRTVISKAAVLV